MAILLDLKPEIERKVRERAAANGQDVATYIADVLIRDFVAEPAKNPWLALAGDLKDDPLFDEWQEGIRENRRIENEREGILAVD